MKKTIYIAFLLVFCLAFRWRICLAADIEIQNDFHLNWWKNNRENLGRQFYMPMRIDKRYKSFSLSILTGYSYTYYGPENKEGLSLSYPLDTKLNFSYEILDMLPADFIIALDLNLPTGRTGLDQSHLVKYTDPDLFSIVSFGEGFNINPSIIITKEWGDWVAGIGLGYLWSGKYDYTKQAKDYDPGDIFNVNCEIGYDFLPDWQVRAFGNYAYYAKDELQKSEIYQEGDFLLFGLGLRYYGEKWDTDLALKMISRQKSRFQEGHEGISLEDKNSHGDEWDADLNLTYFLNNYTTLKYMLQYLRIGENDYPVDSVFYIGEREEFLLGFEVTKSMTEDLDAKLYIKGFLMKDESNWFYLQSRHYRGFSLGLKLTKDF